MGIAGLRFMIVMHRTLLHWVFGGTDWTLLDWSLTAPHIFRSYHIISYLILLYCAVQYCTDCDGTKLSDSRRDRHQKWGEGTREDRRGEELSPSGERKEHGRAGWRLSPHFLPCPLLRLSTSSSSSSSPISCDKRCSAVKCI